MQPSERDSEPLTSNAPDDAGKPGSVAYSGPQLSKGTVGAIAELLACADLMSMGYHVFRAESPHCPFDLIAYAEGTSVRVEVKSLSEAASASAAPSFVWPVNDEWDLLVVAGRGKVFKFWSPITRDEAMTEIRTALGLPPKRTELAACGTLSAYSRHRNRGESCEECRTAMHDYQRERKLRLKEVSNV